MKRILLIDNYDSFVYNIFHLVKKVTESRVDIVLNDHIPFDAMDNYSHIILSPGPGLPEDAGDLLKAIECFKTSHSILGICLGHQAIACHFGAILYNLTHPLHGHKSMINITEKSDPLLGSIVDKNGRSAEIKAGLYHSWAVSPESLPKELIVGSVNEEGIIMSLFHKELKLFGLQFHPESVISGYGEEIISNWLKL
ncbi:MAG: aminodeoxychorismate/anthranilate synthase component II [Bacteroidetes bacterium GWF2_40_14]|nr:MAG: aminodeoxychorismate/anthranilate synthase component II [Bacteroidetes bacterium GWF2_40_14]